MDIQSPGSRLSRAFTLIELIIAMAIIAVVLSVGVPGITSLAGNGRITSAVNSVVRHLHYARSEAVRRSRPVVLCPSLAGTGCDDSFHWEQGFMLFADNNADRIPDDGDSILRHFRPDESRTRILTSPGRKKITYQASGMSPGSTATFTICDPDGRAAPKAVILSNPGRPRLSDFRADGSPLACI
ncbi:MAG: GspH/FimT family pseudopilin [Gammaproteobacteria bacterium]|nr:GspH/FimT family pseudopilin [Gammaproteobacteria bacterium]